MNEQDIIKYALSGFSESTGIKAVFRKSRDIKEVDGILDFRFNNCRYQLHAEVKNELRQHQLPLIEALAKKYKNKFIVIASKITPQIKFILKQHKIAYLESNGNVWLKQDDLLLWVNTNEALPAEKTKINRAFTKTGLRVVFLFLIDDRAINFTYRELVKLTGSGLGNINHVVTGLSEMGFVIRQNSAEKKITKKEDLIKHWINGYEQRLKPELFIGAFRFLKPGAFFEWEKIKFTGKTYWGGEPAVAILQNKLKPAELTIYTEEEKSALMRKYQLVPDVNGNIKVFRKFWTDEKSNSIIVPPLLIYADLVLSEDPRNAEAAQQIYEAIIQG